MMPIRLIWDLARKDLRLFLADRKAAVLCFAVPILLASIFGSVFHRPGADETLRVPVTLVVEDDGPMTARVVAALRASDKLVICEWDRAKAVASLADRSCGVVLVLPAGFGNLRAMSDRTPAQVELLHQPGTLLESRWVEGVFTEIVLREAAADLLGSLSGEARMAALRKPFEVQRSSVPDCGALAAHAYSHSFCGMTLQYLLFWGMDSGLLLLRERRQGIWRRMRAAPVTLGTLLAGKALATTLIALAQIVVTFAFGRLVFGVTLNGSLVGFAVLALGAALLSAATGLLVAALGGNEGRARSVSIIAILTLSMLGGLWLPSFLMPLWVQRLAMALPTTWAVQGFEGVTWQGMGWRAACRCAVVVVGFSGFFLALVLWGFRRAELPHGTRGELT